MTLLTSASAQITELPTDSTTDTLWRTAAANDVDGDGRYGSDGYLLYAWNMAAGIYTGGGYNASTANSQNLWVKPSYIGDVVSVTSHALWTGNGNYGTLENPAGGTHQAVALLANGGGNGNSIRLRITRTSDWPFRLTLIIGGGDGGGLVNDVQNVTVTITNATSTNVLATTHTGLPVVGVSYKQFDIAQGLDDIEIEINGGGNGDNTHLTGLAFDHSVAPITELPTDSTTDTLWRTAAANDVDGDGRYGSDGYLLYAWNMAPNVYLGNGYNASTANSQNIWVKPSYIGDVVSPTDHAVYSGFNGNYGTLENPAGGTHNAAVLLANGGGNGNSIRLRITRTSDWPFRLTLIIGQNQASDSQNITVTITNATSTNVLATTTTGQPTVPVVSYKQFDIAQGLDDIQIEINGGGNGDNTHLTGLAFDHVGGAVQPEISQQPQGGTFLAGVPWQLAVTAAGGSLQYQWFKGNTALPGATSATLSFASLATTDAGSYSVVVSNTVGVVTSAVAVVTVETVLPQRLVNYQAALANELSIISHYGFDRLTAADTTTLHPGTLQGTVRFGEGVGGGAAKAAQLDGGGHVNLGEVGDFDFADGSGAVELWLRAGWTSSPGYNPCVFADRSGSTVNYSIHLQAGKSALDFWNGSQATTIPIPSAGDTWHLLTVVFDSGSWTLYWDGAPTVTRTMAFGTGPSAPTQLGSSAPTGAERWIGALDEMSFYADPLGAEQAQAHFDAYFTGQPPVITTQPVGGSVIEGGSFTFRISATGGAPRSQQWFKNNTPLPGATLATLTLDPVTLQDAGSYTVTVSNTAGQVTSAPAVLQVIAASTVQLVGTDTGTKAAWRTSGAVKPLDTDGDNIYGSDGWLIYSYADAGFQGTYNPATTRASLPAYISSISSPPLAWGGGAGLANFGQIDDPLNAGALRNSTHGLSPGGTPLTLTITRASDRAFRLAVMLGNHPPFAFEEDITVSAGGQAMVRHVGSTTEPAAVYHLFDIGPGLAPVVVTANNNNVDNPGLMGFAFDSRAGQPPVITAQPAGGSVVASHRFQFSVSASGTAPFQYQWFKDNTLLPGATMATLTLDPVTLQDAGSYTVTVRNSAGQVTSAPAVLQVIAASTVQLVGTDTGTKAAWRTSGAVKPLDADGDNTYGSDGWLIYSYADAGFQGTYNPATTGASLPAYISSISSPPLAWGGGAGLANFGQIDDPLNAGALRNSTHGLSPGGTPLTLTIARASDRAFRLAVMLGNHPPFAFQEDITVSAGGQAMVRHVGSTTEPAAVYHLFDIGPGLAPVVVTANNNNVDNPGLMGFAFDSRAAQPQLAYAYAAQRLTLSWTEPGFLLQQNDDLADPAGWTNVSGGETSPVILDSLTRTRFFRLKNQ